MARRTVVSQAQAIRNEIEALKAENAALLAAQSRRKAPLTRQVSEPPAAPAPVKGRKPKAAPLPTAPSRSQLLSQLAASVQPADAKGKRPKVVEITEAKARKADPAPVADEDPINEVIPSDLVFMLGSYMHELGLKRDAINEVLRRVNSDQAVSKAIANIAYAMTQALKNAR